MNNPAIIDINGHRLTFRTEREMRAFFKALGVGEDFWDGMASHEYDEEEAEEIGVQAGTIHYKPLL